MRDPAGPCLADNALAPILAVLWAQRSSSTDAEKNFVYLTITVPDVPKESFKLDLKPTGLTFSGHSDTLKKTYQLELEFYAEIDEKATKVNHTGKNVELKLQKKELNEAYWPRLLKEAKKVHFLRTDFDKWVDEDEQNEAPDEDMSQFGGMGKQTPVMGHQALRLFEVRMANITSLPQEACLAWAVSPRRTHRLDRPGPVANPPWSYRDCLIALKNLKS